MVGGSRNQLADKTRDAYIAGHDTSDGAAGVSVRCLQLGGKLTGAIGFESLEDPEQTVSPLAALTSAHLAKSKAFRTASAASAATQAEVYRSAIGSLSQEQSEMADTVETEADRLGRLTSRLLRMARLDREEVRTRIEMTDIGALVDHIADQYSRQWPERRISVVSHGEPAEEPADPQLLRLALSQLLDNACKYSPPGSAVSIALDYDQEGFAIEVSNSGSFIPAAEQRLIFDRFYRGAETKRHTAGSGLGLYVARKIALAHGGSLQLVPGEAASRGVAFRLKIPSFQLQADHVGASK
jgi:two-component system sensor histidine kinase KdpD